MLDAGEEEERWEVIDVGLLIGKGVGRRRIENRGRLIRFFNSMTGIRQMGTGMAVCNWGGSRTDEFLQLIYYIHNCIEVYCI